MLTENYTPQVEVFQDVGEYHEYLKQKSIDSLYYIRPEIKQLNKVAGKMEIPVGMYDNEYSTELFTLDWNGNSLRLMASGRQAGCGKTTLLGNIFIDGIGLLIKNLKKKHSQREEETGVKSKDKEFHPHRIAFDNKNEFIYRTKPYYKMASRTKRINYPGYFPRGWGYIKQVAPYFLKHRLMKNYQQQEHYVQYDTDMLSLNDLEIIFGLDTRSRNKQIRTTRAKLHNIACDNYNKDGSLKKKHREGRVGFSGDVDGGGMHGFLKSSEILGVLEGDSKIKDMYLKMELEKLMGMGVVGEEVDSTDVLELLRRGRVVSFITAKEQALKPYSQAYVGVLFNRIITAREKYTSSRRSGDVEGVLEQPVVSCWSEFNNYMPSGPSMPTTKSLLRRIYELERYNKISVFADCPSFNGIDDTAITQSHYIFCFQLNKKQVGNLENLRSLDRRHVDQLTSLRLDTENHPNPCAIIDNKVDVGRDLRVFYPLYPLSMTQEPR